MYMHVHALYTSVCPCICMPRFCNVSALFMQNDSLLSDVGCLIFIRAIYGFLINLDFRFGPIYFCMSR